MGLGGGTCGFGILVWLDAHIVWVIRIRRICIGMHIANQALFIDVASLLWAVSIEKAVGADGKPIVPSRTECVDEGLVV
jgi:hypothetical protein